MNSPSLSLFFPDRMDALDRANLEASGVKRVQMFLGVAANSIEQLDYLASKGVRVSLRIEEPNRGQEAASYYNPNTYGDILNRIRAVKAHVGIEAVIIGNEPEHDYDLTWSGAWGNNPDQWFRAPGGKAQAHAGAVAQLGSAVKALGVGVVSPGWSHKRITPRDAPQPGRASWRELALPAYNACDANGAHIYAHDWSSEEDDNRYLWTLGEEVARCHRSVWINETNVHKGEDVWQMESIIKMWQLIGAQPWGGRVVSFCPFVANGTGVGYDPIYIIRDPAAYRVLGAISHP